MPSLAESRRQVLEHLDTETDHDAILAGLQDEIDRHNAVKDDMRHTMRNSRSPEDDATRVPSMKFRFKSKAGREDHKKYRSRSKHDGDEERRRRRKRKRDDFVTSPQNETHTAEQSSHPFPREPADPLNSEGDAFRASLFDALADDEGAAAYWESVYSQPIHVYDRPSVMNTDTGQMKQMSDDEYVDYVKQRMWERKHPEIVYERRRRERERKAEEEEQTRRREEFVRRKEQSAWQRSQQQRFHDTKDDAKDRYQYEFAGEKAWNGHESTCGQSQRREYASAWSDYLAAWDRLKLELLDQRKSPDSRPPINPSKRIPWPALKSKAPTKPNVEAFMRQAPADDHTERLKMLKAERVRWHPDKVQQRFGGVVEEGTMKLVTGVFLVVDGMVEEERNKS